jgi:succinate dehydrogenase / fumarate reductase cytochrome b subunit
VSQGAPSCTPQTAFWLKRIHSLTGLIPLGGFTLEHLYSNSAILRGPDAYAEVIQGLWKIPYILILEVGLIFLPIAFHILLGLYIWYQSKRNYPQYREARNLFFTLQRWTGVYLTVFIVYHVWTSRFAGVDDAKGFFPLMQKQMQTPLVFLFYLGAMMSVSFHFANGIWLGLIRWGVTVGPRAQRMAGCACAGFGLLFFLAWLNIMLELAKGWGLRLGLGG